MSLSQDVSRSSQNRCWWYGTSFDFTTPARLLIAKEAQTKRCAKPIDGLIAGLLFGGQHSMPRKEHDCWRPDSTTGGLVRSMNDQSRHQGERGWADTPTSMLPGMSRKRKMRSKFWWFTGFCNSHYVSHFAAFFIDVGAKTSVAESCIDFRRVRGAGHH